MQHRRVIQNTLFLLVFSVVLTSSLFIAPLDTEAQGMQQIPANTAIDGKPIQIPVGIFITSIYGIDFRSEQYTITFWLWTTYPTEAMREAAGGDYVPFNTIEIVNAQNKTISPTDQYIIPNSDDGTTYAIAKFTATIIQHWDVRNFPFDRQNLSLIFESVGIQSNAVNFVPDAENSLVSEELKISGWTIEPLQLDAQNYEYRSTFGDPSGQIGNYPRITVDIPIKRIGSRLFINSFLGFFIAYVIISLIYFLDVDSRIGLIMTAIFAAVGNKYTIDTYFPNQSAFSLSDLVQVCTFGMIAIGIITTIVSMRLVKAGDDTRAKKMDRFAQAVFVPAYVIIIALGTILAIQG